MHSSDRTTWLNHSLALVTAFENSGFAVDFISLSRQSSFPMPEANVNVEPPRSLPPKTSKHPVTSTLAWLKPRYRIPGVILLIIAVGVLLEKLDIILASRLYLLVPVLGIYIAVEVILIASTKHDKPPRLSDEAD
jgi:hypothetical protein